MERKQIEKAAFKCIGAPCIRDCEKCQDEQKEHCTWSYVRDGFVMGALWRVKSAWHNMAVMPDMNKLPILLEHKTGHIHFVDERLSVWSYLKKHYIRWAYIKDLISEE